MLLIVTSFYSIKFYNLRKVPKYIVHKHYASLHYFLNDQSELRNFFEQMLVIGQKNLPENIPEIQSAEQNAQTLHCQKLTNTSI